MNDFIPGRDQDAAATIRGFRYQILCTIERWLDLKNGEALHLESGEDIDRVLKSTTGDLLIRELEQVKSLQENITLRSSEALTSLVNFARHISVNPTSNLYFRFTTTAKIGRERSSPLGNRKAIAVWQDLQRKKAWTENEQDDSNKIGQFLQNIKCPTDVQEESWQQLMDIVAGKGAIPFKDFVHRFEWSYQSPPPDDVSLSLLNKLGSLPGDTGASDPMRRQKHDQLLATILEVLSTPGPKILTKTMLEEALEKPTLTEHDRNRLELLEEQVNSQNVLLHSMQSAMHNQMHKMSPLVFGQAGDGIKEIDIFNKLPDLPPMVAKLVHRQVTVDALSKKIESVNWLALHGDYGMGKSHLGFLIARNFGGVAFGISMRGVPVSDALTALIKIVDNAEILRLLSDPTPGIVFLDDLPDFEPHSNFSKVLLAFVKIVKAANRPIISTGRKAFSSTFCDFAGEFLIIEKTPPLSNAETKELFTIHNVPGAFLNDQRIESMNRICGGHPMLLTALARYIAANKEEPQKALLEVILRSTHRKEIDLETAQAVIQTVEKDTCRQLLYRLACAGIALSDNEIRILANVEPALPEPTACLAYLDGLWLRRTTESRYEISPLTTPLAKETPFNNRKEIYWQIAQIIFKRKSISSTQFIQAIASLIVTEEYNYAAYHLVNACAKWPQKEQGYGDLGVLLFFPPDKSHGLHPLVELPHRAAQVVTAALENDKILPYTARIEAILKDSVTVEMALGAVCAGALILATATKLPMPLIALAGTLIERHRYFPGIGEELPPHVQGLPPDVHLFIPLASVTNWDDLDIFLNLMEEVSTERRNKIFSESEFQEEIQNIVFRCLFDKEMNPIEGSYARLQELEERSIKMGLNLLAAYSVAGKLVVLGEFKKNFESMLQEAHSALERFSQDPIATSVILARKGQQLYLSNNSKEALPIIITALSNPKHIIGSERLHRIYDVLCVAFECKENVDFYADEIMQLLAEGKFYAAESVCRANAQIGLVRWRQNHQKEAFMHYEIAVSNFLKMKESTDKYQLGIGLSHCISHCTSMIETGKPPTGPDGKFFTEPNPCMFTGTKKAMAAIWKKEQGPAVLQFTLSLFAESLGLQDRASFWSDKALELAIEKKVPFILEVLAAKAASRAARRNAWPDVIEAVVTHGRAKVFMQQKKKEGLTGFEDGIIFNPLEIPSDTETQIKAEKASFSLLICILINELGFYVRRADENSRQILNTLANELEKMAFDSKIKSEWDFFIKIIRLAASESLSINQHRAILSEAAKCQTSDIGLVAHSLLALKTSDVYQAILSQVSALRHTELMGKGFGIIWVNYAHAASKYWVDAIAQNPNKFPATNEIIEAINLSVNYPPIPQAKIILRSIVKVLNVTISREDQAWLEQN